MTNRLHTSRLNDNERRTEQQTIEQIVTNNGYNTSIVKQLCKPKHTTDKDNTKTSWAKFTYFGKQTRIITKLFTQTPIGISLKANHTIGKTLSHTIHNPESRQQFQQSGV
jgi:hypothetical protein